MLKINKDQTKAILNISKYGAENVVLKVQYNRTYTENATCHEYKITILDKSTRRQHNYIFNSLDHAKITENLINDILTHIDDTIIYDNLESFCINFSYPINKESEQIYNKHQRHAKKIVQIKTSIKQVIKRSVKDV